MSKDDFWLGVGAGIVGTGLVLYAAWKLHVASYERGWNGEELKSQGLLGIFGWTKSDALILLQSFNQGKHDREVQLSLSIQSGRIDSLGKEIQSTINLLNKLEQKSEKRPETEISAEERNFLRDLHSIAKDRLSQPQSNSRQRKFYVT